METTDKNSQQPSLLGDSEQPKTSTPSKKVTLPPWQDALVKAEGRFLAITDPHRTKAELGFASMLIQKNPMLQKCTPESIINSVINVARTGITLNPVFKLAHLVPRGTECVLDFDYKGLVKVLKDNKCCKDIRAVIVYKDEVFEESNSSIEPHKHVIKYAETEAENTARGIKGVYSKVVLMDNTMIYTELMPFWEILKARDMAPGSKSEHSPWVKWPQPMYKKTKIKSDFKLLISGAPAEKVEAMMKVEEEVNGLKIQVPNDGKQKPKGIFDTFATDADTE